MRRLSRLIPMSTKTAKILDCIVFASSIVSMIAGFRNFLIVFTFDQSELLTNRFVFFMVGISLVLTASYAIYSLIIENKDTVNLPDID